jgi:hypothetical protein
MQAKDDSLRIPTYDHGPDIEIIVKTMWKYIY